MNRLSFWSGVAICIKLFYFSLLISGGWWQTFFWIPPLHVLSQSIFLNSPMLSITLGCSLLLSIPFHFLREPARLIVILVGNVALTLLCIVEIVLIRHYSDVMSLVNFATVSMVRDLWPSIKQFMNPAYLIFFLDVPVLAGLAWLPAFSRSRQDKPVASSKNRRLCALLLAGILLLTPSMSLLSVSQDGQFLNAGVSVQIASSYGLLFYHLYDLWTYLRHGSSEVGPVEIQRVRNFLIKQQAKQDHFSALHGIARGNNLIIISAESLQEVTIGMVINGQQVTPNLTAFARESLDFRHFYHQTYWGTTSDATLVVMQSIHPLAQGTYAMTYFQNEARALPEILRGHGYSTLSAVAEPADFWKMDETRPRLGFEHCYFDEHYNINEKIGSWLSDKEFFKQTIPFLKKEKEPFMAFLMTSSSHHPFKIPQKYQELHLPEFEGTEFGDYLQSVHYLDAAFGEFIAALRREQLLDRTTIVLYGDHEAFYYQDVSRLLPELGGDRGKQFEFRKAVPFMIRLPKGEAARTYDEVAGQIDVAPTLLSLLGIEEPRKYMLGQDLTAGANSFVVFRDGSFTDGRSNLTIQWKPIPSVICYDRISNKEIDCRLMNDEYSAAVEQLNVSDFMIQGDLVRRFKNEK